MNDYFNRMFRGFNKLDKLGTFLLHNEAFPVAAAHTSRIFK